MEIDPVGRLIRKIKKAYDENPDGWRVLSGKDPKGHIDTFIGCETKLWQIKFDPINPFEAIGVGSPIKKIDDEIQMKLMEKGEKKPFHVLFPQSTRDVIVAMGLESYSSESTKDLKELISHKQKTLEAELNKKLEMLIDKRQPERKSLYI